MFSTSIKHQQISIYKLECSTGTANTVKYKRFPKHHPTTQSGIYTAPPHQKLKNLIIKKTTSTLSPLFFSSIFLLVFCLSQNAEIDDAFRVPRDCGRSRAPRVPIPNPPPKHPLDMNSNEILGMICLQGITVVRG